MAVLPFTPVFSSSNSQVARVNKAQFGDGYEQRTEDGINNINEEWTLSFKLVTADHATLIAFFEGNGGVTPFDWQPLGSAIVKKYVCDQWGSTPVDGRLFEISAHIYRVFEP